MPSRVIRGEINSSDSLSRVSIGAELTFRALLLAVDDYGRLDARAPFLKATLFPMRVEITEQQVMGWLFELVDLQDPPVVVYNVGGRRYIAMTNWERHRGKGRRARESRYPPPPQNDAEGEPGASADILGSPGDTTGYPGRDVGRGTLDVGRGTRDGGGGGGETGDDVPPAQPAASPGEKDNGKPKGKPKPKPESYSLADIFIDALQRRHPAAKVHRTAWAREIEGIGAPGREIAETIDWIFSNKNVGDYSFVVMSGRALATKWAAIRERMGKGRKYPSAQRPPPPPDQEQPVPATPEEVAALRVGEIARLEGLVAGGVANQFHRDQLRKLKEAPT